MSTEISAVLTVYKRLHFPAMPFTSGMHHDDGSAWEEHDRNVRARERENEPQFTAEETEKFYKEGDFDRRIQIIRDLDAWWADAMIQLSFVCCSGYFKNSVRRMNEAPRLRKNIAKVWLNVFQMVAYTAHSDT